MRNKKLTLIELIIVVLVLGLLMGLAIPQFTGVKANADVASFKNDIDVLTKAIDESYVKEDNFPLGEKVTITDPALLDVIYASGDSATNLYKVDLSKTSKYHSKLKSINDANNYFIYSKETGKVFYTKGLVDGESKTLYTLEYVGLSNAKLGADPLVNGMSVPVTSPVQTIIGSVPVSSKVEVKVNGADSPVTVEDVVFEGNMDLFATIKTKTFTSEVLLLEGMNIITIKVDSRVTNFKINLGENGDPVTPEVPVIKPVAVISMTPEQGLTTSTNITWNTENSTAAVGRTISITEWEGKQDVYPTEGSYTVKLRVQDSTGIWSDWTTKDFYVLKLSDTKEIYAGNNYTLALKIDGTLWGVGSNSSGQLGIGDISTSKKFIQIASGVKSVSVGSGAHTMIIKDDNTLWATGYNNYGQLGIGNTTSKNTFIYVASNVSAVSTGQNFSMILKDSGVVFVTGLNGNGQLGTGNNYNLSSFAQVFSDAKSISAGNHHSAIIKKDGTLWMSGYNGYGQYGNGTVTSRNIFVQVISGVKNVSAGMRNTFIIKNDDSLWASGWNSFGQLGLGDKVDRVNYTQVSQNVLKVSLNSSFTTILKNDKSVWVAGSNSFGELGLNDYVDRNSFAQLSSGVKDIASGSSHLILLKEDLSLWGTGRNISNQLNIEDVSNKTILTYMQF